MKLFLEKLYLQHVDHMQSMLYVLLPMSLIKKPDAVLHVERMPLLNFTHCCVRLKLSPGRRESNPFCCLLFGLRPPCRRLPVIPSASHDGEGPAKPMFAMKICV